MTNLSKRSISFLLAIILLMGITVSVPAVSEAASYPTTHPNTHVNTGNGAVDITEVAKTQVGYKENSVGTKYGHWYNGTFVNQPWCAMFVSWCAEQAGISQSVIQKFASCSAGVRWFKDLGLWHDSAYYGGNYIPKKGDIIFYRNSGSGNLSDHVGIVIGMNGTYINVVEGNATNDTCCEFKTSTARTLNSSFVIGYATPKYSGNNSGSSVKDEPNNYELWQVTDADSLSLRKDAGTNYDRLGLIPLGTLLEVTKFKMTDDYFWGYTKYSGKKGWCALDYCTYINGNINGKYYQHKPTVSPTKATLYVQEKIKLTSTNSLGAKYKSSNKTIAVVNKKGTITGVSKGTATIKCKTNTGVATCKVTVVNPTLKKTQLTTCVGEICKMEIAGAHGKITYASKKNKIATIDANGVVKGVSAGTTTVTATIGNVTLKCKVTVDKEPSTFQRFIVKKATTSLRDDYQNKAILKISKGTLLKVTEVKYTDTHTWGKTTYNGKVGWVAINHCTYIDGNINGTVYKAKPYLTVTSNSIYVGGSFKIFAKSFNGDVAFSSNKPKIAVVDASGLVTAVKPGVTKIVASDGKTKLKCTVQVKAPILDKQELHIIKGQKATLQVTGGTDIVWESSNKKIAKVTAKGVISAKSYGTAIITAKVNGIDLQCIVNVYDPVISPEKVTVKKGEKINLEISQNYSSEIVWESSNKKIAKISKKGVVKGKKKGIAEITASVDGVTLTCPVTVTK